MKKVVVDTNVLVSALFWRKRLAPLADLINEQHITLCFSPETIVELSRVTGYDHIAKKIRERQLDTKEVIDKLISHSFMFYPKTKINLIKQDPSDNMFLDCALAASADAIISGDRHLLKLKQFGNIPVLKPAEFLSHLLRHRHPA